MGSLARIPTAINDSARSITGSSRVDRLAVEEILQKSKLPSLNRLVVRNIALECWKGMRVNDGPDGTLNPVGKLLLGAGAAATAAATAATAAGGAAAAGTPAATTTPAAAHRITRQRVAGLLKPPTKVNVYSFVWHAVQVWNSSPELRLAKNLSEAKRASDKLAASMPI